MGKALEHILVKYPELRAKIIELYQRDEDFRILCDDYLMNMEALGECKINVAKDIELESALLQLNQDLENELNTVLKRKVRN